MATATRPKKGQMTDLPPDALWLAQHLQTRDGEDINHVNDIAASLVAGKRLQHRVLVVQLLADEQPEGVKQSLPAGTNLVCDGFHTVRAVRKANGDDGKQRKVPCLIFPGTWKDALLAAAGANAHPMAPLKRTPGARRRAIEMYLSIFPRASARTAADHCHVSHPLVLEVKKRLTGPATADEGDGVEDGEAEVVNITSPPPPVEPAPAAAKNGKPGPARVDWVEMEGLYGKLRRGFAHIAEVHGDLVDNADLAAVDVLMNQAFALVFGKDETSWKARILKQRGK